MPGYPGSSGKVPPGSCLVHQNFACVLQDGVDLMLQILDVVTAEGLASAADEQRSPPFRFGLSVAAEPAAEVFAESDVAQGRTIRVVVRVRSLPVRGERLLQGGAGPDVDPWHSVPVRLRVHIPGCLLHDERRVTAGDAGPPLVVDLDI